MARIGYVLRYKNTRTKWTRTCGISIKYGVDDGIVFSLANSIDPQMHFVYRRLDIGVDVLGLDSHVRHLSQVIAAVLFVLTE
jgi:hypothetical protein